MTIEKVVIGGVILWGLLSVLDIDWKCLFGKHNYVYAGRKSGMIRSVQGRLQGSTRNLYKCCVCGKVKPIEKSDYC